MASTLPHITQSHPAYEPQDERVGRRYQLVVAGLILMALIALAIRPVCRPDMATAAESGWGIRHEQRGTEWYHCEPWIRRALSD